MSMDMAILGDVEVLSALAAGDSPALSIVGYIRGGRVNS
jgi:hypothetical protein